MGGVADVLRKNFSQNFYLKIKINIGIFILLMIICK